MPLPVCWPRQGGKTMGNPMPPQGGYQVGDVVNGARFNGQMWVPLSKSTSGGNKWLRNAGLALIGAMVVFLVLIFFVSPNQPEEPAEPTGLSLERAAYTECKVAVLSQLKSPSSAEFPAFSPNYVTEGSTQYLVNAYVDADNSFGASIRTPWTCAATRLGSSFAVSEVVLEQ